MKDWWNDTKWPIQFVWRALLLSVCGEAVILLGKRAGVWLQLDPEDAKPFNDHLLAMVLIGLTAAVFFDLITYFRRIK